MKKIIIPTVLTFLFSCSTTKKSSSNNNNVSNSQREFASILHEGYINCFDSVVVDGVGNPVHCEASAVVLAGDSLIIASDKEVPGEKLSQVFAIPLTNDFHSIISTQSVSYLRQDAFLQVRKIEDMTKEPAGSICFATTGFDRIRDTSTTMDAYNSLLYWKAGNYNSIAYIADTTDKAVRSSKPLRSRFAKALSTAVNPAGPAYFKIEAICALPDSTLLFGVREAGRKYDDMNYQCIVLSTKYHMNGTTLTLDDEFRKCYELNPKQNTVVDAGLSGIAYNKYTEEIYFSTSIEEFSNTDSARFGAYMWKVSLADFYKQQPAQLMKDRNGDNFFIAHKVEGLAVIGKDLLFTISDQDRLLNTITIDGLPVKRKPYQAVYSFVQLKR